jgi:uncharacterized protein (DUF427 family)
MLTKKIIVVPADGTWVVRAGGAIIGESERALALSNGDLPEVIFFPRDDVGMAFLEPSEHQVMTDGIGVARYFGIVTRSTTIEDAAWSYSDPSPEVSGIADCVTFDTDKVTLEKI